MSEGAMSSFQQGRPPSGFPTGGLPPDDGDRQLLLEILKTIRDELHAFVHDRLFVFPQHIRGHFPGPWEEVNGSLEEARRKIHEEFPSIYGDLKEAGLTGEMLKFKKAILDQHVLVARSAFDAAREQPSITLIEPARHSFWLRISRPVLKSINSILGSLARVIPVLEVAKEYKEQAESGMEAVQAE